MRFLSFHCDYFKFQVKTKSRSKIIEELTPSNQVGQMDNVLVLFISIEKQDEQNPTFLDNAVMEIKKITKNLKVNNIVVLSFAHLFGELSDQDFGFEALKKLEDFLVKAQFKVLRPAYGWFNELELKAKGHPLSRISRIIK